MFFGSSTDNFPVKSSCVWSWALALLSIPVLNIVIYHHQNRFCFSGLNTPPFLAEWTYNFQLCAIKENLEEQYLQHPTMSFLLFTYLQRMLGQARLHSHNLHTARSSTIFATQKEAHRYRQNFKFNKHRPYQPTSGEEWSALWVHLLVAIAELVSFVLCRITWLDRFLEGCIWCLLELIARIMIVSFSQRFSLLRITSNSRL